MIPLLSQDLYFGFQRQNGFFIASPEKAFGDAVYLRSLGRYKFDMTSIDPDRFDRARMKEVLGKFPERTRRAAEDELTGKA